jgi:ATP-binding protein involved in chromosome partitioning
MATSNHLTVETVLTALKKVQDPDLKQDLVTLGMIRDLQVTHEGGVSFRVVLTTPACPMKAKIEADCRAAALEAGAQEVKITMDAQVRRQGSTTGVQPIPGVAHIIAVSSGKGGVGKSTVAVNLAVALAKHGARVGIADLDIYGPNLPTMMGVIEQPTITQDPLKGEIFVPPVSHGVKVMSMGFLTQGDQPVVWRGPMLHSVVNQFCHKVQWGELDYLVVDMPPGTGDVQLSLAQLVPISGAVLVTTPQEVSMQDVRKAFHMFEKVRVPVLGIVENMSYFVCDGCTKRHYLFGRDGGKLLAKKFSLSVLAELPLVPEVRVGGDEGRPIVVRSPDSEAARGMLELGEKVAQQISVLDNLALTQSPLIQIGKFS